MQIYIHRNNEDFGPYSKEAVLEYLKQGVFQAYDYACYQGMSEWKTVNELLGIGGGADNKGKNARVNAFAVPGPSAAAMASTTRSLGAPQQQQRLVRRRPVEQPKKRAGMIVVNLILAALVGAGIYLRMGGGGERGRALMESIRSMVTGAQPAAPESAQTSAPAQAPAPAVLPTTVPAAPAIPVAAVATPTPPLLPSTVHITVPVKFPAMMGGQVVGSVSVPQGTEVKLVKADKDQLIINYQGGMVRIARNLTDLDSAPAAPQPMTAPATATVAPSASKPAGTPDPTDPDAALGAGGN